ncbi:hypothetical protein [Actinoplanes subglobosus]|uniref:Uncharacterized protein n=1 Tax=Actinoplanes subglobosus TaxID=1547892 RepID=A0ABV8IS10_9ACTN
MSAQALALLPAFAREVTSTELRALAFALGRSGYLEDAESIWERAIAKAAEEGVTQELHARRGYAEVTSPRIRNELRTMLDGPNPWPTTADDPP